MGKNNYKYLFVYLILLFTIYLVPILWTSDTQSYKLDEGILALIDVDEERPSDYVNPVDKLIEEYNNTDIKGILTIDNTDYSTAVTQSYDNDYYLYKSLYKEYDGLGTPFIDYRIDINNTKKLLIFAHNSRYKEMPFRILENYYSYDYLKEHKYLTFTTTEESKTYEIFSVYVDTSDFSYYQVKFNSEKEWFNHIKSLKAKSMYDTGVELTKDDNIIILQTCSTLSKYSSYKHKFLVVMAKEVE